LDFYINTFGIDEAQNTPAMWASRRGDICQYLGATGAASGGFRLPMPGEVLQGNYWQKSGTRVENNAQGNALGTFDMVAAGGYYATYSPLGGVTFPAAGQRNCLDSDRGLLKHVGYTFYYWTSSPGDATQCYMYYGAYRNTGMSVRCLLD
jgi:hypothetical protein